MILSFSGHRPDKLPDKETGYKLPNPTYNFLCQATEKILLELKPEKCISGMTLGFDSFAAFVCIKLGIPFIAAIPFVGQESVWPDSSQKTYRKLLSKASEQVIVSEGGYSNKKLQIRNEWMMNNSDMVVACWNGSNGGTKNCLDYAKSIDKKIYRIDPITKICGYIDGIQSL